MRAFTGISSSSRRITAGFAVAVLLAALALVLVPRDAPVQAAEGGTADEAITPPPDPPSLSNDRSIEFGMSADGRLTSSTAKKP